MARSLLFAPRGSEFSLGQKFQKLNILIVFIIMVIAAIGFSMLYSVAGGSWDPWAKNQAIRFSFALLLMIGIGLTNIKIWMSLAYPAYAGALILLVMVEFMGVSGMGGQRWLDLVFIRLQPSEIMKVALILALARYFHSLTPENYRKLYHLIIPILMITIPAFLVIRQPDLGTTALLAAGGITVIFLAGARAWLFWGGFGAMLVGLPFLWGRLLDYQKDRITTFLNPESDPLGAGYQIIQSKIALGSGGLSGKGFMQGTQSHLNFLPEMKTDFIFTVLAEEFGLFGGLLLLGLYGVLILYGLYASVQCRSHFGRLLAAGLTVTIFLYVFINVGMVMGLLPVVGVPLPLVSYGGSAMLTVMIAYGLIFSVAIHRNVNLSRADAFG